MNLPFGFLGGEVPMVPTAPTGPSTLASQLAAIAAGVVSSATDPIKQEAVLEAKLQSAIARGAGASEINLLRAKLEAARRASLMKVEGEQATREWRTLGQVLGYSGVAVAATLILALLSFTFRRS